jgi:hypothetical protein
MLSMIRLARRPTQPPALLRCAQGSAHARWHGSGRPLEAIVRTLDNGPSWRSGQPVVAPAVGPYLGQWPPAAARGLAGRAYLRHLVRSMSAIALHSFDFRTNAIQADENAGAAAAARICGTPGRAQVVTPLT